MTRMQLIARLVVTYLLMCVVSGFLDGVHILIHTIRSGSASLPPMQTVLLTACLLAIWPVMFYALLCIAGPRMDALLRRDGNSQKVHDKWVVGGHRLVLMYFGLRFITSEIDSLIAAARQLVTAPRVLIDMLLYRYVDDMFHLPWYEWLTLIRDAVTIAIGLYLLCGAPRFVVWLSRVYVSQANAQVKSPA